MSDDTQHKFADRLFRKVLADPRNLADLVAATLPDVAATLDFTKVEYLNRTGSHAGLQERESDVLCLTAIKDGPGETLCCVLIEHQSTAEANMPLRVLEYAVQAWSQAWANRPGKTKRLHGILPIVLYTGHRPWNTHRQLEDLIAAADPRMYPHWPITYFCVDEFDPVTLATASEPFINALAIVRVEKSDDLELLVTTFTQIVRRIAALSPRVHDRFRGLMEFLIRWIHGRLPQASHDDLLQASYSEIRYSDREEFMTMTNKLGLTWQEETVLARKEGLSQGRSEGRSEGRTEGRELGKKEALHETLIHLLEERFTLVPDELRQQIDKCSDPTRLQAACIKVITANSITDIEL